MTSYVLAMILDDLADFLAEETTMTVQQAVLLLTADGELPRFRMSKSGLSHHALFSAPAGRFLCDLQAPGNMAFFSEVAERTVEVGELVRLDPKQEIVVERNWPSGKVQINGRYYAVPPELRPLARRTRDGTTHKLARPVKGRGLDWYAGLAHCHCIESRRELNYYILHIAGEQLWVPWAHWKEMREAALSEVHGYMRVNMAQSYCAESDEPAFSWWCDLPGIRFVAW